jgi:ribose transport system permease protein
VPRSATAGATRSSQGLQLRRAVEAWTGPLWIWGVVVVMLVVASVFVRDFGQVVNFQAIAAAAVPLAIVAVGETFVVLTGSIDISVAVLISMGNTLSMGLMNGHEGRVWYALILTLLAGLGVGIVSGTIVAKANVPAFIVTLGAASVLQGIVFAYTNQATYGSPAPSLITLGFENWGPFPALFVLFLPLLAASLWVQNRTRAGRHVYAVGGNADVARLAGIHVDRIRIGVFAASGALAALAGIVISTRIGSGEPLSGTGYDWDAITAVVIGGTALRGGKGGIGGTMAGVLIVSTVNDLMTLLGVSTFWQTVVKGAVILGAIGIGAGGDLLAARHHASTRLRLVRAERTPPGDVGAGL